MYVYFCSTIFCQANSEPVFPLLLDEAIYKYAVFHDKNELISFKELQEPLVYKSGYIYEYTA